MDNLNTRKRALCNAIERKCGFKVSTPADFTRLSSLIYDEMHEYISDTTLKRVFGYIEGWQNPRPSIWNLLCRYAGFVNEEDFLVGNGVKPEAISGEISSGKILVSEMEPGTRFAINWYPNHSIHIEYIGNNEFKILEKEGTSLKQGGFFKCTVMVDGDSLILSDYYPTEQLRNEDAPGILYEIGREGGIEITIEK